MKFRKYTLALLFSLLLVSCIPSPPTEPAEPTATPSPESSPAGGALISELLLSTPENNNREFIELYNAGGEELDLKGWSLWYRLAEGQEEKLVYTWGERSLLPSQGHYLLAIAGEEFDMLADAVYEQPLFDGKGGLLLRDSEDEVVDVVGWGDAPASYVESQPAPAPAAGSTLERLPGGEAGNGQDTDINQNDFVVRAVPAPQNSGSPLTPLPTARLELDISLPSEVEPGDSLSYRFQLNNLTGEALSELRAVLPLPSGYEISNLPTAITAEGESLIWRVDALAANEQLSAEVVLQAPWTYAISLLSGSYAEAGNWGGRAYGPLQQITISGGTIPIATARQLEGEIVTVEGVATMYTGGFYAGSTGTKFYLEDESGGIQVYCPGGQGVVSVDVGQRVRVTGEIELYRNAVEIIPADYSTDLQLLAEEPVALDPPTVEMAALSEENGWLGRLAAVEGIITRLEEYSYSYEVDLLAAEGQELLVYVEKDTGINLEPLEVGKRYRVKGINELYLDQWQLKPRVQTDFARLYPPELLLELEARNSVLPGEFITYTLTAFNHTAEPLHNLFLAISLPPQGVVVEDLGQSGVLEGAEVSWQLDELAQQGGSASVSCVVRVQAGAEGPIISAGALATASDWPETVVTPARKTFVGSGVPIWAIQGTGMSSPYVREVASTEGVVTAVFPELGGFWLQSITADEDPATSEGLFVLTEELTLPMTVGDQVVVRGKVREKSGQTLLQVTAAADFTLQGQGQTLPAALELDPPEDHAAAQLYYEAREGMLVQVTEPAIAVAPTTKYGEYVLVRAEHEVERVMRGDPLGRLIFVDDGSEVTHLDQSTLSYTVQSGDRVSALYGPLAYTYEQYKIEPVTAPLVSSAAVPLPTLEPVSADQFSIATFNAENFFDIRDPHPSDPPKLSAGEYRSRLTKAANAILAMGAPTVIGLQEIENLAVLEDIAAEELLAEYEYQAFLIEGTDSRGIDNGYLVRGDLAKVEGISAHPAPEGLTSRPPLLITVTVQLESSVQTIYLLNNHFTSMSAGEEATEPRRNAQAAWNVTLVERLRRENPTAKVAVLGDLNSFYTAQPLDTLRAAGLRHIYEYLPTERPYSYIYQGESETLDHILVTPSLYEQLVRVEVAHINADYPLPAQGDTSARRSSDHDPVVAVFGD